LKIQSKQAKEFLNFFIYLSFISFEKRLLNPKEIFISIKCKNIRVAVQKDISIRKNRIFGFLIILDKKRSLNSYDLF